LFSLQTSRTYCAAKTEDLSAVIEHVRKRFPGSPAVLQSWQSVSHWAGMALFIDLPVSELVLCKIL